MADKKYIARTIPLAPECADILDRARVRLTVEIGFEPSYANTVAFLAKYYLEAKSGGEDQRKATEDAPNVG